MCGSCLRIQEENLHSFLSVLEDLGRYERSVGLKLIFLDIL